MESREKFGESTVQFKNREEEPETTNIERRGDAIIQEQRSRFSRTYRITRILRVIELLILVALLVLVIYLMVEEIKGAYYFLLALFVVYLFILSIDMMNRITGRTLPDTLMFLAGVLGFLLFAAAAQVVYSLLNSDDIDFRLLFIMILCSIEAILFLVDFTLLILNWRQACMRVDKCPFSTPASNVTTIYKPDDSYSQRTVKTLSPPVFERVDVQDVTTSVSDYERPSHPDLANLHKYRKIGEPHRREYIDRPVNAPSSVHVKVIEVQTDPPRQKEVSDVESLIVAEVKEERVQTVPKCPVCANNWDPQSAFCRPDNFGPCPTFLHMAQGFGMCNCSQTTSRPFPVNIRTESMSATDVRVPKNVQKPNPRRNSTQEER